ncbi:transketolase [Proteiniclasticum ruminis]|uniref:Transketolase subunit A n=1 Tax=Proteiniclasticum ruminis TaxID=398199 RepID=A0A1I5BHJ0_9CLOT|nr:transketolase [Proteiniclasticum ruminis]SFN74116.1 transketolase subunit A [Proteiniclasticum ruminis]
MTEEKVHELKKLTHRFRNDLIDILYDIQTGHPGGSLSAAEIVTTLYFDKLRVDPKNPKMEGRDRFIMSKGHACPILYLNMAEKGYFPKEDLKTLRQMDSHLQGHPCAHKTPGVELSAGPLGLGLGAGLGMALGEKMKKTDGYVYVLLGDGEVQEGGIWEAAMAAAKYKADNLIAILDHNGVQLDGTLEEIMCIGDIAGKFEAFGWEVLHCDGHDIASFSSAVEEAKETKGKPIVIIAKTVKGKGVSFMEGKNIWHGKPISPEEYKAAKLELGGEN